MSKKNLYPEVDLTIPLSETEQRVLGFWEKENIFQQSLEGRKDSPEFTFYDGPPFATGLPHYGHLVASTLKDIIPRYWTMRGFKVNRRFGWDTHGLPIEMLVEKKLGLSGPTSIREYGIDKFNEECRANVLTYTNEWRRIIGRLGRWVDFDNGYKTMDLSFMESVWWVFKQLWDKDLIYTGYQVMPYSWRLSTSLSNFEANMDYREIDSPALTVEMPALDDSGDIFLVWTTTPWTLPSNLAIAISPTATYLRAYYPRYDKTYIVAKDLADKVLPGGYDVLEELTAIDLDGRKYMPPFSYFLDRLEAFRLVLSDHVTTSNGTGLVHLAPDFGEDDFKVCRQHKIRLTHSVDKEGNFADRIVDFAGRNIFEAQNDVIAYLKNFRRVFKHDTIRHKYPFCWRSGEPLIYRATAARFVKVTELKDRMVQRNKEINWVPDNVGQGRFANWLEDARDWNISRNRFWGTPIPIWVCDRCDHTEVVGSVNELEKLLGASPGGLTDIHPHRIDSLNPTCPECQGSLSRIPDVFDCWFESGAMPYAQNHYPFEDAETFEANFPADFIAEGLDQTRGWFYTLLILSTALFDRPPFRNVIVNGMVLAKDGGKMSKSKQNYPPAEEIFEQFGADALRAYLINSPIVSAQPLKFNEDDIQDVARKIILPLRSALSFFTQYANLDGWSPGSENSVQIGTGSELDRWIVSLMNSMIHRINLHMENYDLNQVVPELLEFVDQLTNWYIRRSRRRFWTNATTTEEELDKKTAYSTLYYVLTGFSKILAPFLPFLAEEMWQTLIPEGKELPKSVHLTYYPTYHHRLIDLELEESVKNTQRIVSMGRYLRSKNSIRTRQPLRSMTVAHYSPDFLASLRDQSQVIMDELNIKELILTHDHEELVDYTFIPVFSRLGKRFGKRMPGVVQAVKKLDYETWLRLSRSEIHLRVDDEDLTIEDIDIRANPRPGKEVATDNELIVALDTRLDSGLIQEGLARELVTKLNQVQKEQGLELSDRVDFILETSDTELSEVISTFEWIASEVLGRSLVLGQVNSETSTEINLGGRSVRVEICR